MGFCHDGKAILEQIQFCYVGVSGSVQNGYDYIRIIGRMPE
jgi:hypothetical protein